MNVGNRIKQLRKLNGWNQTELANKVDLGFSVISCIETGKSAPTVELIEKLANIFNVSIDYLVTGKEGTNDISEEERDILSVIREDKAMRNAMIEVAKVKKKAISYARSYQSNQEAMHA